MKKFLIPLLATTILAAGGAGWWVVSHRHDHLANAARLTAEGKIAGARLELMNAVRSDPDSAEAHFRLGMVQLRLDNPVAAAKELKRARELGKDAAAVAPGLAQAYIAERKFRDVLAEFPAPARPGEKDADILVRRAYAQMGLQDLAAAEATMEAARQAAPKRAEVWLVSGRVAVAHAEMDTGLQDAERAIALDPALADAALLKAQILARKGGRADALAALDAVLAKSPDALAARLERADLLISGNEAAKARPDVDAVLKAAPNSPAALYFDAVLKARDGRFNDADAVLQRIEPVLGQLPRGDFIQAMVKAKLGQVEQATAAVVRYLARSPDDPAAVRLLVQLDLGRRQFERPIDLLSRLVSAGHADGETYDLLGRAYALAGKGLLAAANFRKAAELAPKDSAILRDLASVRMASGDVRGAEAELVRAVQANPDQAGTQQALILTTLAAGDIARAREELATLRLKTGETEMVGDLTGAVELAAFNLRGAHDAFAATARAFPKSVAARLSLARVAALQGDTTAMDQALTEVLAQLPANPQALGMLVPMLMQEKQYKRAEAVLDAARAAAPSNPLLSAELADVYVAAGDPKQALTVADPAMTPRQALPAVLGARARAQAALKQNEDARASYRQILAQLPTDLNARLQLANLLVADKDDAAARRVLEDGLAAQHGNPVLMNALIAVGLRQGGMEAGLAEADRLAADRANLPIAAALRGDVYMNARKFDDAANAYAAALKATPSGLLAVRQALALNAAGHADRAAQMLRDWLAGNPDDPDAAAALSSLEVAARQFDAAAQHLKIVLARRPNDAAALNNLAWIYGERGDKQARALAEKAFLLSPTAQAADTLGWILVKCGDAASGLDLLKQAQVLKDPAIQYHLAVALGDTGQRPQAISVLKTLVASPASFPDRDAAQKLLNTLSVTQ